MRSRQQHQHGQKQNRDTKAYTRRRFSSSTSPHLTLLHLILQEGLFLNPKSFPRKLLQNLSHLAPPTTGIHNLANFEPVEATGSAHRICAHIIESEPIAYLQGGRQRRLGRDTVNAVAGRAPDGRKMLRLRGRDVEGVAHRQDIWVDDLVVEEDAVERAVHPIVDVVYAQLISTTRVERRNEVFTYTSLSAPPSLPRH